MYLLFVDFIKEGIGFVARGITSVAQSAIYAATDLCSGIEQVRDFSLSQSGDFLGIASSAKNAIDAAEKYGRQAWASAVGFTEEVVFEFRGNVQALGYEAQNLVDNITAAFRGYTKELFEDVAEDVRGFNVRAFVIGLLQDIRDAFSFIDIDGFIDDFESGIRKWKEFDISELGRIIVDAIPTPDLLEERSRPSTHKYGEESQLFNTERQETILSLASFSKEERMEFLEKSFQTFMANAENEEANFSKKRPQKKTKRKQKPREQKPRGTSALLDYGVGLQDLQKDRVDTPIFMSGHDANVRLQQDYTPPTIDCNIQEIIWIPHSLNITEIADSIEPCLCEVLAATLAVTAVGFFIPGCVVRTKCLVTFPCI